MYQRHTVIPSIADLDAAEVGVDDDGTISFVRLGDISTRLAIQCASGTSPQDFAHALYRLANRVHQATSRWAADHRGCVVCGEPARSGAPWCENPTCRREEDGDERDDAA